MDGLVFTAFEMTVGIVDLWEYSAVSGAEIFILNIEIAGSIEQQPSKLRVVGIEQKSEVAPTLNVFTTE